MFGMFSSGIVFEIGLLADSPRAMVAAFVLSAAILGACESAFWTTVVELGGTFGGTAAGLMNTGGNAGGTLSPYLTPLLSRILADRYGAGVGWRLSLAVAGISREDAENVYRIRAVIESLITEQFIERADDQMVRLLLQDAEVLKDAYRSGDLQSMLTAKRAFYDRLSTGAKNQIALDTINRLVLLTSSLRARSLLRSERQKQSVKEITRLVAAIKRRDVEAARKAAEEHVRHSASSALQGS